MNLLAMLRDRFATTLEQYNATGDLTDMIRPAQDTKFGDYQANFAMPLGKQLSRPPREVAEEIVQQTDLADICQKVDVAGPGFINLTLKTDWLAENLLAAAKDDRLGIATAQPPRKFVVDYSSPNVAKPMHVGHIRSTVIGDAISRVLRFLGHDVITDNHLGDWGTQFGMIIYGFKHFRDQATYASEPVTELSRLYRLVRRLIDFHSGQKKLPELNAQIAELDKQIVVASANVESAEKAEQKKAKKELKGLQQKLKNASESLKKTSELVDAIQADPKLAKLAADHPEIGQSVLLETAKLHEGDAESLKLWEEFLPSCRQENQRIYDRLSIEFDHELGESFYHPMLGETVDALVKSSKATESEGAMCVFLDEFDTPMIVRKSDGAFLYATTDLATIKYRMEQWKPDEILYVVDHRQGEHFAKLFAVANKWGYEDLKLFHVSFGTVMGDDKKPFQTRAGDTVGLENLLDEAVARAQKVVDENSSGSGLKQDELNKIADIVGIGAIKYADLSQNRSSDYVFSYDKMLALTGNTSPYLQYSFARVQGIFRKGNVDIDAVRKSVTAITLETDQERKLAIELLRFEQALADVVADWRPSQLTAYLYGLAKCFMSFFEACPVVQAETEEQKNSRLLMCDLTARTIRTGLELLGIGVTERM